MFYSHRRYVLASLMATTLILPVIGPVIGPAIGQVPKPSSIGVVDKDKVVNTYPKALQAADELKKGEDRIRKLLEDSNKQYEDAKAQRKPQGEIDGLKTRLQSQIDEEVKKLQSKAQLLEGSLEKDIENAIRAEAQNHKVDAVFMKQAVFMGGVDLTDGVMKRLASSGKNSVK